MKQSRIAGSTIIFEKFIDLCDKHIKMIRAPYDLTSVPQIPLDDRKRYLLRVFHCKSVCKTLKKVPEGLKLAVIATRCWLRNNDTEGDRSVVLALVHCVQTCFEKTAQALSHSLFSSVGVYVVHGYHLQSNTKLSF